MTHFPRRLLMPAALALLLAACSSNANNNTTTKAATQAPAQSSAATTTSAPTRAATTPTSVASAAALAGTPAGTAVAEAAPVLPTRATDKDGKTVAITSVDRIIPLNGEITEIIYELGLGKNVAGVDISSTYPPEAQKLPSIGYQRTLAAEAMLALKPTLIVGNENAGPPPVIEQLRGAGVPVLIIKYQATIDTIPDKIRAISAALGVPGRGEQLVAKMQTEIGAAKALAVKATSHPKVAFLNVRAGGTQQIWGKGFPSYDMIIAAGAVDAATQAGIEGSKPITAEALVTAQPEIILVTTTALESAGGIDGLLQIPGIAQTPAGQNKRVLSYEDQFLLGMGPRTGQALLELVKALHPELKGAAGAVGKGQWAAGSRQSGQAAASGTGRSGFSRPSAGPVSSTASLITGHSLSTVHCPLSTPRGL